MPGPGFRRLFPTTGTWLELAPPNNAGLREIYALLDDGILEAWIPDDGWPEIIVAETGESLSLFDPESDSTRLNRTPRGGRGRRARGEQVCRRPRFPSRTKPLRQRTSP